MPNSWHLARVAAIFKKGNPAECSDYKPISLLCSSYKLFAIVLFNRLRAANVDEHIRATQFGFKRGARVTDALFMARRFIDNAHAKPDGKFMTLTRLPPTHERGGWEDGVGCDLRRKQNVLLAISALYYVMLF